MKTIYTTLPIYDSLAKQAYERAKKGITGQDRVIPIVCPLNELPSFQWLDFGDGCSSVSKIELIDLDLSSTDISGYFISIPASRAITGDTYFYYNGGSLSSPIPCGFHYLKITMDNAKVYYSEWVDAEDIYNGSSTKYLILEFSNSSDLGNILYSVGFNQKLWFVSEAMEQSYPIEEEGAKDGQGRFIRTFARQTKQYLAKTLAMPDYMVDVFNRLRLHDTIILTDLVGDTNDVYNLEVKHEWLNDDKYYAKIELTFDYDETVVAVGCGNNFI